MQSTVDAPSGPTRLIRSTRMNKMTSALCSVVLASKDSDISINIFLLSTGWIPLWTDRWIISWAKKIYVSVLHVSVVFLIRPSLIDTSNSPMISKFPHTSLTWVRTCIDTLEDPKMDMTRNADSTLFGNRRSLRVRSSATPSEMDLAWIMSSSHSHLRDERLAMKKNEGGTCKKQPC